MKADIHKDKGMLERAGAKKMKKLKCWEMYGCENKECPAYKSRNFRCWLTSGSESRKADHGKLSCKTETCLGCKVYKANVDAAVRREVDKIVNKVLRKFRKDIEDKDREMEKIDQFTNCILCACCYTACPVVARDERYLGPAALAKLFRFVKDPRDRRPFASWAAVNVQDGVWSCDTVFKCNEVCPKEVRPADGIEALRRRLLVERLKRFFKKKP